MADVAVQNPATGELRMVAEEDAPSFTEQTGWSVAGQAQREHGAKMLESGTAGQQTLAAGETALRTATLGLVPGVSKGWKQRAEIQAEEHPYVRMAATGVGALAPALATGGLAGAAAGAVGLGEGAAGLAAGAAEGLAGGAAQEIEDAREQTRDVSVGNIFLYGLGGEIAGRALPAAFRMGAGRIRGALTAAEEVAGEGIPSALAGVEAKSVESQAQLARGLPEGAERAAALERTAPQQYEHLATEGAGAVEQFHEAATEMTGPNKRVVERIKQALPEESPAQVNFFTDQKKALMETWRQSNAAFSESPLGKEVQGIIQPGLRRMDKATTIADQYFASRDIAAQLEAVGDKFASNTSLPPALRDQVAESIGERVQALRGGLTDESLFGNAAKLESDLSRGAERMHNGLSDVEALGDPGKMRKFLQADRIDRARMSQRLDDALEGAEDLLSTHEAHGTLDAKQIAEQRARIGQIREARNIADEIQVARAPKPEPPGSAAPTSKWFGPAADLAVEAASHVLPYGHTLSSMWRLAKRVKAISEAAQMATKQTARKLAGSAGEAEASGLGEVIGNAVRKEVAAAADRVVPGASKGAQRVRELLERSRARGGESGMVDVGAATPPIVKGKGLPGYRAVYNDSKGNIWDHTGEIQGGPLRRQTAEEARLFDKLKRQDHIYVADEWRQHILPEEAAGDNHALIADIQARMAKRSAKGADAGEAASGSGITLYRAAENDAIGETASFSPDRSVAEAYHDNPSFGGPNLFRTKVSIKPKTLLDISAESQAQQLENLVEATGIQHPGAATADHMLGQSHVLERLREKGIEWVKLTDTYPEGAETYTWIGGKKEPVLSAIKKAPKPAADPLAKLRDLVANHDDAVAVGAKNRALDRAVEIEEEIGRIAPDVDPDTALEHAREILAKRRGQEGSVTIESGIHPQIDRLSTKLQARVSKLRELEGKEVPGAVDELGGNAAAERHAGRLEKARGDVQEGLHALRDEFHSRVDNVLEGRTPEELGPKAKAKYDRYKSGLDELEGVLGAHGAKTERVMGKDLYELGDNAAGAAEAYLSGKAKGSTEAGYAQTGVTLKGILTSPMALTAGAGGALLAAPKAVSALQRFQGEYSGPDESFLAKKKLLDQDLVSPDTLFETLGASMEDLPKLNPELYQKLSARVAQSMRYVRANLPPGIKTTMMYPDGIPPSTSALRDFATIWNTTMQPHSVLEDIDAGTATGLQMKTLKETHPDIYEQLHSDVVSEIGQNFRNVPLSTKLQMDILFDADGMAGPFFSSKAAGYIQQANKELAARGPASKQASPPIERMGSQTGPTGLSAIQSSVTNKGSAA